MIKDQSFINNLFREIFYMELGIKVIKKIKT